MQPDVIVGAGLTGLLAAHAWPRATIIEQMPEPKETHRALLRFRSDAVARLTGAEFKKVKVRKGIWLEGEFVQPSIRVANLYAQKIMPGTILGERSIWNIDPVDRYVAADTFYEELLDAASKRITWGAQAKYHDGVFVSTAPLPEVIGENGVNDYSPGIEFKRAAIHVWRFDVHGADIYQTVYFADRSTSIYRASMTGRTLIVEAMSRAAPDDLPRVFEAFALGSQPIRPLDQSTQRYGKIAPINEAVRRELLFRLTHDYKIYSLGRFATWRNILLDDVVNDIDVIKRLMRSGDSYELKKSS